MAHRTIDFFPFFLDVLDAVLGGAAPFLHEVDGFIAKGYVLQGIFLELVDLFTSLVLPFPHHFDVRTHIGRHAVFQPALSNAAQAVRDADGNRDLDGAEGNDRRQKAAGNAAADGTEEGNECPFTQFDVIDFGNAGDQIDFIGHQGDRTITVTATEIGFDATPDAAAETAYAYGRSGNVFTNFFTWLRCAFKGHDVASDNLADMDADALRTRIEREAAEINVSLSAGSIEIDEAHSAILVVKGASMITLDPAAVADRVLSDIRAGKFGTSAYPVDMSGDDKMTLQELHDAVCGDPVNAGYDPETQSATESKVGIQFDVAAAQPLWDAAANGDTVTIPATLTQPEMTQERLQQHLLADKLATKTTSLSGSSSNRITNVKLAAEKINGVILQPGQTFSYNDVVGQRTKANGFKEAGAYSNGQVVQEVGGGICQVSSTLYYCAMVSNLKINTRTCHYFPVAYIEPGMDAAVSWGGPEFKFTNNRDYPIEIKAYVQNGSVTVEIWGTDVDGSYVKMSYTSEGLRATTYRTVYDKDGNQISHTLEANSTYHSHDTTPKPTPTPSTAPKPTPTPTPQPQPTPYPSVYDPGDAGED